jgi:hypothetical protein
MRLAVHGPGLGALTVLLTTLAVRGLSPVLLLTVRRCSGANQSLGLAEARSDWARLPLTKPCHPSTGRVPAPRPDRGTTLPSHSRAESMLRRARGQVCKAGRYPTHSQDKGSVSELTSQIFR